jgi:hypothetical protein
LLDRKGVKHRFPSIRVDDIDIAAVVTDASPWLVATEAANGFAQPEQ